MESVSLNEIANGLNVLSWDVLEYLNNHPSQSYSAIRVKFGFSQEKISKEMARLEGAVLVKVERDPNDNRSMVYNITRYGRSILKMK
ncbi:MarR family transcriptional regulator [Desertibacillus haloalkaliphilus]|uniref:MarR family transcriptional regulator n=1 Tax=Desertibacillus haloalkaliphilus TaxID=1328930 RepID=UPI001C256595|nr:MarR family transcriptional regulator [Desertibacillus haloalkaliphilus]MBU8908069.1 hypothetical protein [Desertibacillus haloalkaliphilus]